MIFFRIAGIFLIVLPIAFNILFFALGRAFEYPNILRKPTDEILKRFSEGGSRLIGLWYAFAMTAVLMIPLALMYQLVFIETHRQLAASSAVVGALAGLVQALGLFRWVFLVPSLAKQYNAETATPATREAVGVVFHAFHQYAGVAIGEHLGYLLTGVWTLLISSMMFSTPIFGTALAVMGIISALGILAGLLEPAGWKPAGAINAIGYIIWSLWLLISGVILVLA
jgi:hypothetical protein